MGFRSPTRSRFVSQIQGRTYANIFGLVDRCIDPDSELSGLFKDVFLYHWKEERQHAILDELELVRHHATLSAEERDRGVDEFIALVAAVDGILRAQAAADASYFTANCRRAV